MGRVQRTKVASGGARVAVKQDSSASASTALGRTLLLLLRGHTAGRVGRKPSGWAHVRASRAPSPLTTCGTARTGSRTRQIRGSILRCCTWTAPRRGLRVWSAHARVCDCKACASRVRHVQVAWGMRRTRARAAHARSHVPRAQGAPSSGWLRTLEGEHLPGLLVPALRRVHHLQLARAGHNNVGGAVLVAKRVPVM